MDAYEIKQPESDLVIPRKRFSWKRLLIICGALVICLALGAGYLFFTWARPRSEPLQELSLTESVKAAYAEAWSRAYAEGDYQGALQRIDEEMAKLGTEGAMSAEDLYAEAKLKIYKADVYMTGTKEYDKGFGLLRDVYYDTRYDNSVGAEAIMLAMAYATQGLDEGSFTIKGVQDLVLSESGFGDVVQSTGIEASLLDERFEVDGYLARGFNRALELANGEKVYRLAQSYLLRLYAPNIPPPSAGDTYRAFTTNLLQFELDMHGLANSFPALEQPYEEFIVISLYNLIRAYESLTPADVDIVDGMERAYDDLERYLAAYPDEKSEGRPYLLGASARISCRMVDEADFDAARIDTKLLAPHLTLLLEEGTAPTVPCLEAFSFIADEIDPRFAPYF